MSTVTRSGADDPGTEYRIYGPPGTGKTTFLKAQVEKEARQYGSEAVVVTSFTKAAAQELVARDLPIPRDQIGTLHALCYRALGTPPVAEGKIKEWNEHCPAHLRLSGSRPDMDEPETEFRGETPADMAFQRLQRLRALQRPPETWPLEVRSFAAAWETWKEEEGYIDFTDMIEQALDRLPQCPGQPTSLLVDEAQDLSPLELALVRQWGSRCERFFVSGDEDQTIFSFKGASVESFLSPIPDEQKRVLRQSYRIPAAVHAHSQRWIKHVSRREPKEFRPRDEEGRVERRPEITWRNPRPLLKCLEEDVALGRSAMILASCSYMLAPTIKMLREVGLPYDNPWRRSNGAWNPLQVGRGISSAARLYAFLAPQERHRPDAHMWTLEELAHWAYPLAVEGVFHRGAKKEILEVPQARWGVEPSISELLEWLTEEALTAALDGDLAWYEQHLLTKFRKPIGYPLQIIRQRGAEALRREPLLHPGTIHAVKGGESDRVYLFPDLSQAGAAQWQSGPEGRDAIIRTFYVGMTRARHTLTLCGGSSGLAVPLGNP